MLKALTDGSKLPAPRNPYLTSARCSMATPSPKKRFDGEPWGSLRLATQRPAWMEQRKSVASILSPAHLAGDMPSPPPSTSEGPTPEPKKARLSWAGQSTDLGLSRSAGSVMDEIMGIAPAQEEMSPKSLEWMQALFSEDELGQKVLPQPLPQGLS